MVDKPDLNKQQLPKLPLPCGSKPEAGCDVTRRRSMLNAYTCTRALGLRARNARRTKLATPPYFSNTMGEARDTLQGRSSRSQLRTTRLKLSSYVDSIRDNFKRNFGNGAKPKERGTSKILVSKKSDIGQQRSSFEIYLSTIPRLDPVDRTVGWVMMQPEVNYKCL